MNGTNKAKIILFGFVFVIAAIALIVTGAGAEESDNALPIDYAYYLPLVNMWWNGQGTRTKWDCLPGAWNYPCTPVPTPILEPTMEHE